jgi:carbonic anhydrase/acetyltransferase-like protein (isoleucine patch superfamily)
VSARTSVQDGTVLHTTEERPTVIDHGSLVAAGALVAEGTVAPPDHRALGVPASIKPSAGIAGHT